MDQMFTAGNITIMSFVAAYAGGVLTSFTPCVYPLLPIIVGVIGSGPGQSKVRNFISSLCYVAGMAITFAVLGVAAAVTGRIFGQIQMSPLAHIIVGAMIILFALSLAGVIPLPTDILFKAGAGRMTKGKTPASAFVMGAFSGLIAAPCATSVIGGILAYVASTQNVILGFSLLFVFALGLGTLLILVGTFAGIMASLPRSGKWTGIVEKTMAFAMIALGCYFIFRAGVLSV